MFTPCAPDVVQRELDERVGAGPLSREPQAGDLLIQLFARQLEIAVEQDLGQGRVGRLPGIEFIHPALDQRAPRRILGEERVEERGRLLCVGMLVRRLQDLEIDLKQQSRHLVLDLGRGLREIRKVAVQELPVSARFGSGRARESAERGLSRFEVVPRPGDEERGKGILAGQRLGGDERLLEKALPAALGRIRRQARNELQGDGPARSVITLDRHRVDRRRRERPLRRNRGFPASRRLAGQRERVQHGGRDHPAYRGGMLAGAKAELGQWLRLGSQ